jgi:uncharacterized protein (UPF0303 family)
MNDANSNFEAIASQENDLVLDRFSRADALAIGLKIIENGQRYPDPIAVEIAINGLVVFRHFTDGSVLDSELWLARKRKSVDLMSMSSLRFKYWLEMKGKTLSDRHLNSNDYTASGGGFPIRLAGTGVIGSICVSGLPSDLDDHQLITDSLGEFLAK